MLKLSNNVWLIEKAEDLPSLPTRIDRLYMDLETSSLHPDLDSLNPWKTERCRVWLAAFTWDDHEKIYCIPRSLCGFIEQLFERSSRWINQNVKYDAHAAANDGGMTFTGEYEDTLTLSKLVDSDRTYKGGYGLDVQVKHYLGIDLSPYYLSLKPWLHGNKDYGRVPIGTLADYAGNQVRCNRLLHAELERQLPEETWPVWQTEKKLTTTLLAIERRGMVIDIEGVRLSELRSLHRMMVTQERLEKMLGYEIKPDSQPDCEDLFINRFGMPAIYKQYKDGRTSKGPSFAKDVLKEYLLLPGAPVEIIRLIQEYRHESTMRGLFWGPWQELHIDGVLHSSYNQIVRSGRTSCSDPNSQQFNNEARALIKARPGFALVCKDYSQIEFRLGVDYLGNERIIKLYNDNPKIDFHQLMADEVGIKRKPAKIMNLALIYSMGKKKTLASLRIDPDIMEMAKGDPHRTEEVATAAYFGFHRRLPEVKKHTRMAEDAARRKGYVRNKYGRRSHSPLKYCHSAFNRVIQGHAADLMKERTNALHDALASLDYEAHLLASVHDETLSEVELDHAIEYGHMAQSVLNASSVPLRVPIRCSCGVSASDWLEAKRAGDSDSDSVAAFENGVLTAGKVRAIDSRPVSPA